MSITPQDGVPYRQPWGPSSSGSPQDGDGRGAAASLVVIIEASTGGGENTRWGIESIQALPAGTSREQARVYLRKAAFGHQPKHPLNKQTRSVYRLTEDGYLVAIQGMTALFHFRVTLAEHLQPERPGDV